MSSMELYRTADRLEWTAWTIFTGDETDGDGNMVGYRRRGLWHGPVAITPHPGSDGVFPPLHPGQLTSINEAVADALAEYAR